MCQTLLHLNLILNFGRCHLTAVARRTQMLYSTTGTRKVLSMFTYLPVCNLHFRCSVAGETFAPSGDTVQVSTTTEGRITIEGASFPATVFDDKKTIYCTCIIGKCRTSDHPFCLNVRNYYFCQHELTRFAKICLRTV